jgi:hypothetical protein
MTPEEVREHKNAQQARYMERRRRAEAEAAGMSFEEYMAQRTERTLEAQRRKIVTARSRVAANATKEKKLAGMPSESMKATGDATAAILWETRASLEECGCGLRWADHMDPKSRHENPGRPYSAGSGVKSPMTEDGPVVVPSSVIPSSPVEAAPYSSTGTIREAAAAGLESLPRRRLATEPYAPCIRERQEVAS